MKYLLPCGSCRHEIPIDVSQAGQSIGCPQCHQQTTAPTLRGVKALPPAEETSAKNTAPAWSPTHGALFSSGVLLLVISLLVAGAAGFYLTRLNPEEPADDGSGEFASRVDSMTPSDLWQSWQKIQQEGIGERHPPQHYLDQKQAIRLTRILWVAGIAAVLGLALTAAPFLFFPRGSPSR